MLVEDARTTAAADPPKPHAWSRGTLIGFRFAFSVAVLSALHLVSFVTTYVQPAALKERVNGWLDPIGTAEFNAARSVGVFIMRLVGGATGSSEDIARHHRFALLYLIAVVAVAVVMTVLWTALDWRRTHYSALNRWLRVYARYTLAIVTMAYAVVKVMPTQFGYLAPGELLKPVGQLTRFWVLWDFMVVSTGYTVFAGLVELLGCALLFFRRTTLLGALLIAAALTNVFAMDLAYQVFGAAMVAGLLLALSGIVIAPYATALVDIFVLGRTRPLPVEPSTPLSRLRFAGTLKAALLVALFALHVPDGLAERRTYFGRGHGVFGLFEVDRVERAGALITPLANDAVTWKRVGTDGRYDSGAVTVQFANGDVRQYRLVEDTAKRLWILRVADREAASLQYAVEADGNVSLTGRFGDAPVKMHLRRIDVNTLPLLRGR